MIALLILCCFLAAVLLGVIILIAVEQVRSELQRARVKASRPDAHPYQAEFDQAFEPGYYDLDPTDRVPPLLW